MLRGLLIVLLFQVVIGRPGFGPTDQEWGYVNVRKSAHLFWWLHYTTADVQKPTDKPLIIWLQGGPGASSTGYGNFEELGPLNTSLQNRSTTWVQWANILFVDNPVGSGFSYTNDEDYAKNNTQIAEDFLVFLKSFYKDYPQFEKVPLYIFCESYGGKMTTEIGLVIYKAQKNGEIPSNLKGIAIGDGFVSPLDTVLNYAPYLLNLGAVDDIGYKNIMNVAQLIENAINKGNFVQALGLWGDIGKTLNEETMGVDFYNVLSPRYVNSSYNKLMGLHRRSEQAQDLDYIMNKLVKPALNLTSTWNYENYDVYFSLDEDFMKPVTHIVEEILNTTELTVAVYNGQLDLIISTPGTVQWVTKLNFNDKHNWDAAPRIGLSYDGFYEGYVKKYKNLHLYWVDKAGHMVPSDNPKAMYAILDEVTNHFAV